jgi:hypothetical protein
MVSTNPYIFWYRSAIVREPSKTKDDKSKTPLQEVNCDPL